MQPILELHNVWKQYQIGGQKQQYLTLRERLSNALTFRTKKEKFWALQAISFDVFRGDCIGIIGRNGAGKSTLLKILSKITPPTKGHIKARGRIASLLEVGTGFHPELTGRENIYLNGAILGLQKVEINRKFDEIVAFSGVEQFLDTPLKHYSSGMNLRLAFSVAAYLEPEILLIDEVLAVGDAEFQKKCIGRMNEVSRAGRTVIFVSHDLEAVRKLCQKGIILEGGKIRQTGLISEIVDSYLMSFEKDTNKSLNKMIGKKILKAFTIHYFNMSLLHRKMQLTLELKNGNFNHIKSIIYNIFSIAGQRISLLDLRKPLLKATANTTPTSTKLQILTQADFSHYVEGIYYLTLGIEYQNGDWYESERLGFELVNTGENDEKYAAKYRGYFEIGMECEVVVE